MFSKNYKWIMAYTVCNMLFFSFPASSEPLAVLSDRENLLIEHPSMFVVSTSKDDVASPEQTTENSENKTVANTKR